MRQRWAATLGRSRGAKGAQHRRPGCTVWDKDSREAPSAPATSSIGEGTKVWKDPTMVLACREG